MGFNEHSCQAKGSEVCTLIHHEGLPYFLDWNARVLLGSSELLEGVVFEGAFYSRARSISFSLSVTKFFSKHNNLSLKALS